MKYQSRSFKIKNGSKIEVRQTSTDDSRQLLSVVKEYISTTSYIPLYEQEFKLTDEQEKNWIRRYLEDNNSLLLVAVYNGAIIGNIDLTENSRRMLNHTGVIGMGILKEWRNMGVGTILLEQTIYWAKKFSSLEIIWLQVFANNLPAISLYKKLGFSEDGRQMGFIKDKFGQYQDNVLMSLRIR